MMLMDFDLPGEEEDVIAYWGYRLFTIRKRDREAANPRTSEKYVRLST